LSRESCAFAACVRYPLRGSAAGRSPAALLLVGGCFLPCARRRFASPCASVRRSVNLGLRRARDRRLIHASRSGVSHGPRRVSAQTPPSTAVPTVIHIT